MTSKHQHVVADYRLDPNDSVKTAVATALGFIPEAGELLSGLVEIFWPYSHEDVWGDIEQEVEALVQQQIDRTAYQTAKAHLTGLQNVLGDYAEYAKPGHTPDLTSQYWTAARVQFDATIPVLQVPGQEVLLLPLWAQAANMQLGLLRDGVMFGNSWGWKNADVSSTISGLQTAIAGYTAWAPRILGLGLGRALATAGVSYHGCQPFKGGNAYRTQAITGVMDLAARWPYFDPTAYPPPVTPDDLYLNREIYSDPVGTADDSGLIMLPWRHPTQPLTQITIWSGDRIDAIQVSYPGGGGPDMLTQTARMGSTNTGSSHVVNVSADNPIVAVSVWAGDVVEGLQFSFKDGSTSPIFGKSSGGTRSDFSFRDQDNKTGHILSSIHVNGMSKYYTCADCVVFGFRYEHEQAANLQALRRLYVTSPAQPSLDDLVQRSAASPMTLDELTAKAHNEQWDTQRTGYWARLAQLRGQAPPPAAPGRE